MIAIPHDDVSKLTGCDCTYDYIYRVYKLSVVFSVTLTDCESNTDFFRVCNPSAPITLSFEYTAEEVDALPEQLHFPISF